MDRGYPPLLAPNGAVVAGAALAAQAGIDVLQNGGTAMDACVAALITELEPADWEELAGLRLCGLIAASSGDSVLQVEQTLRGPEDFLRCGHTLLRRRGTRSLYDLLPGNRSLPLGRESTDPGFAATVAGARLEGPEHAATVEPLLLDASLILIPPSSVVATSATMEPALRPALETANGWQTSRARGTQPRAGSCSYREKRGDGMMPGRVAAVDHCGRMVALTLARDPSEGGALFLTIPAHPCVLLGSSPYVLSRVAWRRSRGMSLRGAIGLERRATSIPAPLLAATTPPASGQDLSEEPAQASTPAGRNEAEGVVNAIEVDQEHGMIIAVADPHGFGPAAAY